MAAWTRPTRRSSTAARMVDAEAFILKLEKGYDTEVGEGGNRLSTGQKQLISFARAMLANPAIFVLDEATSSVDTETEQKHPATPSRRCSRAAPASSSLTACPRCALPTCILVIQNGKITEDGTHHELIAKRGYYYQLYTNQFQEERGMDILSGKA